MATFLYSEILRPLPGHSESAKPPANTHYWQLATGSHIAYWVYDPPAGVAVKPEPIVFLHGGPGLHVTANSHRFYSQFARDGFRVFLFDQAGSGFSDRLPVKEYSFKRAVADLEEIRKQIGAPRVILIGHSWGAVLAANYMASYPEHVAKVVFASPGPMWNLAEMHIYYERTAYSRTHAADEWNLRVEEALRLFELNPTAAEHFVSQSELSTWWQGKPDPSIEVCPGRETSLPTHVPNGGSNLYVNWAMRRDMLGTENDPHPHLRSNRTPAIILYGDCDFVDWSIPLDYRMTLPSARVFYFAYAGHTIEYTNSVEMVATIRSFLLDQKSELPAWDGPQDPRWSRHHAASN